MNAKLIGPSSETTCWNQLHVTLFFFLSQHVFTMDPKNVESGRGKVPHDPIFPFASTFSGMFFLFVCFFFTGSQVVYEAKLAKLIISCTLTFFN